MKQHYKQLSLILCAVMFLTACPKQDKWNVIFGALDGAPDLIASFGVTGETAHELTADFAAISAAAHAVHDGKGVASAVADALDKLRSDGSRLLSGTTGQRISAIVAFLKPFFPTGRAALTGRAKEPTDADVAKLRELMKPLQ